MAKPDKDSTAKADYRVKSPLHHDGELYEIGEKVTLTERQASRLPAGAVEPLEAKAAEKPTA
jgi:hypothetical protein